MISPAHGLLGIVAAVAAAIPSHQPVAPVAGGDPNPVAPVALISSRTYKATDKEFYLASDQVGYIRPGLKLKLNSITIPADRKPVVDLSFTDDFDQPLDRAGKATPGAISFSFVLSWYDATARQYTSYATRRVTSPITNVTTNQAAADSGGTFRDVENGHFVYTFGTALPATFDGARTHTLGIYSTRNLTDILGKNYVANLTSDFRPDGRAVAEKWEAMHDAKACLRCHDPLQAHGGARREVKLCVLCHSPQTIDPDTGNTVDFKVMVHKIHRGKNLPSVKAGKPYIIIGNAQRVFDFSTVADPQDLRNCETCHEPTAAEAHIAFTRPNRAACASCHDDVNFETGANHVAGPQADDRACASCHRPQGDVEFDASVKGAHTIPEESTQLKGLKTEIMSVDSAAPGRKPVVTFKVTNGDGSIVNPSSLASMQLLLGGPTTDNSTYVRENARTAPFNGTTATYTFTAALPADAKGTWMISADSYRNVTLNPDTPKALTLREAAANPITYVPVTDAQPKARRTVVNLDKCQKCHERLALHGGQRFVIEECVICHNPNEDDRTRRPPDKMPAESVDFKRLIHRLHRGEELTQDFTVYGFTANPVTSPNPVNFNEVRYPGDLRNCQTCHTTTSYKLPSPGILPTATKRDYYTPMQPGAAACLGCHDNRAAAAHAFVQTAPFGEACESCHGNNSEFSVDRVHAR